MNREERTRLISARRPDCWPTAAQRGLLRAALLEPAEALASWEGIRDTFERSPRRGLRQLGPLIVDNLWAIAGADPILKRLRSRMAALEVAAVHRRGTLRELLCLMSGVDVDTMLLKGAALELAHYPTAGRRPMRDVDLAVPLEQVAVAREELERAGWQVQLSSQLDEGELRWTHGAPFVHPSGSVLDLHWHTMAECLSTEDDEVLWEWARTLEIDGAKTRILAPPQQLLHTVCHGCRWSAIPTFGWIADAAVLLRSVGGELDWGRFVWLAERLALVPAARDGLRYFETVLPGRVPPSVVERLKRLPTTMIEERAFLARTRAPDRRGVVDAAALFLDEHDRLVRAGVIEPGVGGYRALAHRTWGVGGVLEALAHASLRAAKRVRSRASPLESSDSAS